VPQPPTAGPRSTDPRGPRWGYAAMDNREALKVLMKP
jgi:hypothetical protein